VCRERRKETAEISEDVQALSHELQKHGGGLGLTSMQERVRLVNGTITVESRPRGGTTIHVRVPVKTEHSYK